MFPQPHGIPFGLQVVPILVLLPLLLILLLVVLLLFTIAIDIANTTATATAPTAAIGAAAAARLLLLLVLLLLLRLLLRGVGYRDHTIGAGGSSTRNMWTYILLVFLLLHQFEYCPAVSDSCWTPGNEWWEHLLRIRCPVQPGMCSEYGMTDFKSLCWNGMQQLDLSDLDGLLSWGGMAVTKSLENLSLGGVAAVYPQAGWCEASNFEATSPCQPFC